ncbi:MAG: hypothetical protein LBR27_08270 [Bifidobacteriaceae bacterium]|jgi:hypothetical protein|nr:hypothetical protein [Bifidobacteriaceae bacterium]
MGEEQVDLAEWTCPACGATGQATESIRTYTERFPLESWYDVNHQPGPEVLEHTEFTEQWTVCACGHETMVSWSSVGYGAWGDILD